MTEALVRRHPTRGAGYAELLLPGAAVAAGDPRFRLVWAAGVDPNLGPRGWQPGDAVLHPDEARVQGNDLILTLGPAACDHLVAETYEIILLAVPARYVVAWIEIPRRPKDGRDILQTMARRAPDWGHGDATLVGRRPAGGDETITQRPPLPTVQPTAPDPPPPPVTPPDPAEPATGGGRRALAILGVLLVLLLLAAGLAWWWLMPEPAPPPAPTPDPPRTEQPTPPAATCMGGAGEARTWPPAREIMRRDGCGPDQLPPLAVALHEAGRHDDALLLLQQAAELGVAPAMTMLGRMYDPNGFQPGRPFAEPDSRQAARYYAEAVRAGDASAEAPRGALQRFLEEQARAGNLLAELTLRDYWP